MKFTDPETQELFVNVIHWETVVQSVADRCETPNCKLYQGHYQKFPDQKNEDWKLVEKAQADFISHVESRLRREQQPCEWEKALPCYEENLEVIKHWHFCPICGRKLEGR